MKQQLLTSDELLDSSRGPECSKRTSKSGGLGCSDTPGMLARKQSSSRFFTSLEKLKFDIAQFRHIAFEDLGQTHRIMSRILPKIQTVYKRLIDLNAGRDQAISIELSPDLVLAAEGTINRLIIS